MMPDDHPALTWLFRRAAPPHNRWHSGADGHTSREWVAGKRSERQEAEFGEQAMSVTRGPRKERQSSTGIWLGSASAE